MSDTTPPNQPGSDAGRLRETADEARQAAGEKWQEAKQDAQQTARRAAEEARRHAEDEVERGKAAGAGQMHQWASAIDRAADELGSDTMQGQFLRQASEGIDDVARSFEGRSAGEMIEAVATFGRRNPLAFVGTAMIAGFALSRFATASRPGPDRDDGPVARGPSSPPAERAAPAPPPAAAPGEGELRLTDPMGSSAGASPADAPGTASAPTGTGRPYPSAGPVPGQGRDEDRT